MALPASGGMAERSAYARADAFPPSLRACAVTCIFALLALAVWGCLQSGRGLWQDESILLANLGLPVRTYFHQLPFYDQAAPPFALLALDSAYLLAQGSIQGTRLVLLAFHMALLCALAWTALRRADRPALLAIAVVAATPYVVHFSLELKQYMFEIEASLAFMLALRWHLAKPAFVMIFAAVLSYASFSIMLVVGVAVLDALVFRLRGPLQRRWFGALVLYTGFWLASYLVLFRPAVAMQTANYPTAYQHPPLTAYVQDPALVGQLASAVIPAQPYLAVGGVVSAGAALLLLRKLAGHAPRNVASRSATADLWQPARVWIGIFALVGLLWLANIYPVSSMKQFVFTMPVAALWLGQGVVAVCSLLNGSLAATVILAALLVPNLGYSAIKQARRSYDFQDTRGLYAFVKNQRDALIVPDLMFEPTLRAYAARDPEPPRKVAGWLKAETKAMEAAPDLLADLAAGNMPIHQHAWQTLYTADAYPAYLDWVVRKAQGSPVTVFAAAQFDPAYEPTLLRTAGRRGCEAEPAFRSRDVVAYRITCARRRR